MTRPSDQTGIVKPRLRWRWLRWNLHRLTLGYIAFAVTGVFASGWSLMLLVPGALLVCLVGDGMARPSSNVFYPTITHGPRVGKRVALTFDDGPDPEITPQVLDVLAQNGARATFFVIGKSLAAQIQLGRRMLDEGHVIGNHSWQHSRWQNFRQFAWHLREIGQCDKAIATLASGQRPRLYRPPVGLKTPELARAVWVHGLTLVAWSLHSHDTWLRDPERIAHRVLTKIHGGDIVLLHDGHDLAGRQRPQCVAALRLILGGLRARALSA